MDVGTWMMEVEKRGSTPTPLIQHKFQRLDWRRLAGIVLSEQDIDARGEMHYFMGKATKVSDMDICNVHDAYPIRGWVHASRATVYEAEVRRDFTPILTSAFLCF
jgi:hypothetical protein